MKIKPLFGILAICMMMHTTISTHAYQQAPICKLFRMDCKGWFTGDRDICVTSGNSLVCTNCGEASECY